MRLPRLPYFLLRLLSCSRRDAIAVLQVLNLALKLEQGLHGRKEAGEREGDYDPRRAVDRHRDDDGDKERESQDGVLDWRAGGGVG